MKLIEGPFLGSVSCQNLLPFSQCYDIKANECVVIDNFLAKAEKIIWDVRNKTTDVNDLSGN